MRRVFSSMDLEETFSLNSKTALVGGSTSGIGKAIATRFAEAGAQVVLLARNEDKLQETLNSLPGDGHHFLVADFSDPDQVENTVASYLENGHEIDILVNNTGGPPPGSLLEASLDEFLKAYKMHLMCNQLLTQLLVPSMKRRGAGRIINIISTSVRQPIPNLGVSNTTRGAVANWAKTLAHELGEFNITVNNILPGFIRTPRLNSIILSRAEKSGLKTSEQEEKLANSVPLRRIGEPEEIANGALFLASNAASYVSGTNLVIDGGRTKTY